MTMLNNSRIPEFILLGFPDNLSVQFALFYIFIVLYMITLTGNVFIIVTTGINSQIHRPMYFFLSNLSFLEIFYTSTTIPKILFNFLNKIDSISFVGCAFQLYFFVALGGVECSLLAVMAFDRYVAVCNPLHYVTIMDPPTCLVLIFFTWISGFINSTVHTTLTFQHNFCANVVSQFFCDLQPLWGLVCGSTIWNDTILLTVGGIYGFGSFFLTLVSYVHIIHTILKMKSKEGQQKAFSTCGSHLLVVTMFYGTAIPMCTKRVAKQSSMLGKLIPMVYAVITPSMNPLIYTMRNKEFKNAVRKMFGTNQLKMNPHIQRRIFVLESNQK